MNKIALLAALLMAPAAGLAQTTPPADEPPASAAPAEPRGNRGGNFTYQDALRHHQPTRSDVGGLEGGRNGSGNARRQRTEQNEIDELYQEILRNSTPRGR